MTPPVSQYDSLVVLSPFMPFSIKVLSIIWSKCLLSRFGVRRSNKPWLAQEAGQLTRPRGAGDADRREPGPSPREVPLLRLAAGAPHPRRLPGPYRRDPLFRHEGCIQNQVIQVPKQLHSSVGRRTSRRFLVDSACV
jgi:hypothetical protein